MIVFICLATEKKIEQKEVSESPRKRKDTPEKWEGQIQKRKETPKKRDLGHTPKKMKDAQETPKKSPKIPKFEGNQCSQKLTFQSFYQFFFLI